MHLALTPTGKSMVVSRLTQIKLPSAKGTCTRTPLCIQSRTLEEAPAGLPKAVPKAELNVAMELVNPAAWTLLKSKGWTETSR